MFLKIDRFTLYCANNTEIQKLNELTINTIYLQYIVLLLMVFFPDNLRMERTYIKLIYTYLPTTFINKHIIIHIYLHYTKIK